MASTPLSFVNMYVLDSVRKGYCSLADVETGALDTLGDGGIPPFRFIGLEGPTKSTRGKEAGRGESHDPGPSCRHEVEPRRH